MIHQTPTDTTDELEEVLGDQELQDIKKKSVSGAASYFGRTIFLQAIGLGAQLVLSAYFTPEDFGVYGYVLQFIGLLTFFSDIGLAASLIQKKEHPTLKDYRTAFTVQQLLSWLIFAVVLVIVWSGIIQQQFGMTGVWILLASGIAFPLASFKTISAIQIERKLDFPKLVVPQIFEQIAFNVILIVLALKGFGAISFAYAIFARSVVGTVLMFMIQPWAIGISIDVNSLRKLMNFGLKFQLNDLIARVKDNLFFIVIGAMMTPQHYGYMSWAKQWSMYPYNLTVQNVMAITFPTFSRLQGNKEALRKAIEKSLYFITLGIFPIIVGMSVFIYPLTQVVEKYNKWEPTILSFVLFSLSIGWSAISSPLTNTLNAVGKVNQTLKLMVMWTVLTWVVTPLCLRFFGYHGVAIGSFLIAFSSIIPVFMVKKIVDISVLEQVWRHGVSAGVMGGFGILLMNFWTRGLEWLLIGMMSSVVVYAIMTLLLGKHKLLLEIQSLRSHKAV